MKFANFTGAITNQPVAVNPCDVRLFREYILKEEKSPARTVTQICFIGQYNENLHLLVNESFNYVLEKLQNG